MKHSIKPKSIIILAACMISAAAFAQTNDNKPAPEDILLSLDAEKSYVEAYGVPTVGMVEELRIGAEELFAQEEWEKAIPAFIELANKANWLANLLSQCVDPYYHAPYDDRKSASFTVLNKYTPYEKASNNYKKLRDHAFVRVGLCFKNLNKPNDAVMYLYKALDHMSMKASLDWETASSAIAELTGFSPDTK